MARIPETPLDIRNLMHDCILAIFWPKRDIVEFFKDIGCPTSILIRVDNNSTRRVIVDTVFSYLSAHSDPGLVVFQKMSESLSNWSHFDYYHFDQKQSLDKAIAQQRINDLRTAILKRNQSLKQKSDLAHQRSQKQEKTQKIKSLSDEFSRIYGTNLTPQERGKIFESFLRDIFNRQDIIMHGPFRIIGEEIDGTFKFEGENYIVEAKWHDGHMSTKQLYAFACKVDGKLHGRGLFISVHGFTCESFKSIVQGKHIKTILMDGQDISYILEDRITLEKMLDFKIRAAQTRGEVYVCAITEKSKI